MVYKLLFLNLIENQLIANNSTSKFKVALGGMTPGIPYSP